MHFQQKWSETRGCSPQSLSRVLYLNDQFDGRLLNCGKRNQKAVLALVVCIEDLETRRIECFCFKAVVHLLLLLLHEDFVFALLIGSWGRLSCFGDVFSGKPPIVCRGGAYFLSHAQGIFVPRILLLYFHILPSISGSLRAAKSGLWFSGIILP
jgi:hypothetical protein